MLFVKYSFLILQNLHFATFSRPTGECCCMGPTALYRHPKRLEMAEAALTGYNISAFIATGGRPHGDRACVWDNASTLSPVRSWHLAEKSRPRCQVEMPDGREAGGRVKVAKRCVGQAQTPRLGSLDPRGTFRGAGDTPYSFRRENNNLWTPHRPRRHATRLHVDAPSLFLKCLLNNYC